MICDRFAPDHPTTKTFWRFVAERHTIFVRRHIWRQPPPWTNDPVLTGTRFTNIYRDLDRVSRHLIVKILPQPMGSAADQAFNILVYRRFSQPATFALIGGPRPRLDYSWPQVLKALVSAQAAGQRIFTSAFMLTSANWRRPKRELVVHYLKRTAEMWPELWARVQNTPTLVLAHGALQAAPGLGGFMAYELLIDYCQAGLMPFSLDEWAWIGPGALKGLAYWDRELAVDQVAALVALRQLRTQQIEGLRRADCLPYPGPLMDLENCEQALCEYGKYERIRGGGKSRRRYTARVANDDELWCTLCSKYTEVSQWITR